MPDYNSPGVYIEEIPGNIPSIECVATAVPAFIGYTERAYDNDNDESLLFVAKRILSLVEFETFFGGPVSEDISITVDDSADGDGLLLERKVKVAFGKPSDFRMYYQMQIYFLNGGGPCYIMSVGDYGQEITALSDSSGGLSRGLAEIESSDEPTILLFPDRTGLESLESYTRLLATGVCF